MAIASRRLKIHPWGFPLILGVVGLCLSLVARGCLGYPRCPGDEGNWALILQWLDQGIAWPVSGPGFVWVVQQLSLAMGWGHDFSLALLGMLAAAAIPMLLYGLYRYSGLQSRAAAGGVAWLMVSSYFLGPLLEARPQQWGMILLLMSLLTFQRLEVRLNPLTSGLFLMAYGLLFFVHILSFMVLNGLLAIQLFLVWVHGGRIWPAAVIWLAVVGLAAIGLAVEAGPYRIMMQDMRHFHFRDLSWWGLVAVMPLAIAAVFVVRRSKPLVMFHIANLSMGRLLLLGGGALLLAGGLQALLAPPQYLAAYQGDLWRFLLVQGGNLIFALCFVCGLWKAATERISEPVFLSAALGMMVLGALVLFLSPWLGDKNGMIRIINYWMLFAAPVAWEGLGTMPARVRQGLVLSWPFWVAISLFHVTKPAWLLGC